MNFPPYQAPFGLGHGLAMTAYAALRAPKIWTRTIDLPQPPYEDRVFLGEDNVPIFGWLARPPEPKGTIVATYGIVGDLENQWFLQILGRKAYAAGYAVVLFDWRAHGRTADLSPTLTSDGLFEGRDFVRIAAAAKAAGCPAPFWFAGYSLGGQLALWAIEAGGTIDDWAPDLADRLTVAEIGGGVVVCPSLDSTRSLRALVTTATGRYIERGITRQLQQLARRVHRHFPEAIDSDAITRATSIWGFDQELVIGRLGFATVEDYYTASSPMPLLDRLRKPTLIFYAIDDPLFAPELAEELAITARPNPKIDLVLTAQGGHVGYVSSRACQHGAGDPDRWWAWNRTIDWLAAQT